MHTTLTAVAHSNLSNYFPMSTLIRPQSSRLGKAPGHASPGADARAFFLFLNSNNIFPSQNNIGKATHALLCQKIFPWQIPQQSGSFSICINTAGHSSFSSMRKIRKKGRRRWSQRDRGCSLSAIPPSLQKANNSLQLSRSRATFLVFFSWYCNYRHTTPLSGPAVKGSIPHGYLRLTPIHI